MLPVFSACQIWTLFTSHLHMYMSSAYYLSICVLCTYYLQCSLISSFLTNNANVIYMSSLVLFIDPYMLYTTYTHYLLCIFHIPHIAYYLQLSFRILSPYTHVIRTSSIHHLHCYPWSAWAWTIFYCDRNLLLNGICGRNVELFHFRIM